MSTSTKAPRKTTTRGRPPPGPPVPAPRPSQQRGEAVVAAVLEAVTEELAKMGYGALRFEDVAARAGVAKTTIYRRWPTKRELVADALSTIASGLLTHPRTGHLRSDLMGLASNMIDVLGSARGQAIVRMMTAGDADLELLAIARALREDSTAAPRQVILDAIARGEVPTAKCGELLLETMMGAIHHRVFFLRETPDQKQVRDLVDLLLDGACDRRRAERRSKV